MSEPVAAARILSEEERDEAKSLGADVYLRSKRYRSVREEHLFAALDAAVTAMEGLRFPNPYDGRILGSFARTLFVGDGKAIGYLRQRNLAALDDAEHKQKLFTYVGMLIAEAYLSERRAEIPSEPRLSRPGVLLAALADMFDDMRDRAARMQTVRVLDDEITLTLPDDVDPENVARALIEDVVLTYESLVPETDESDDVPDRVQREAISKAAFMQLAAADLAALASAEGFDDLPNKTAMAIELARKYGQDLDKVAELVVRRTEGDPEFGLVTRLVPLSDAPNSDAVSTALEMLQGRYFEPRPAVFFIFGPQERTTATLHIKGTLRSFTVNPAEAGGRAQVNFRARRQPVTITLRPGDRWAEVDTRRAADLNVVRAVLRRTGEILPLGELVKPDELSRDPFSTWDTRTLWMLDFIRRDLQAPELRLDDMLMANFITPDAGDPVPDDDRTPNVDAVRLLGRQLQDHPEACTRIADRAQLRDIEVRLRKITDATRGFSKLIRVRLSWEKDHLAVMSGADEDGRYDDILHRQVVGLVRQAARRELDEAGLRMTLLRIQRRASGGGEEDGGVFDAATG